MSSARSRATVTDTSLSGATGGEESISASFAAGEMSFFGSSQCAHVMASRVAHADNVQSAAFSTLKDLLLLFLIGPQARFRLFEDVQDRPSIVARKMCKGRVLIFPNHNVMQARDDVASHFRRQPIEGLRVDQVTAWKLEHPRRQIEVAQRSTTAVARAGLLEIRGELGRA
jgi:hypothetical protein